MNIFNRKFIEKYFIGSSIDKRIGRFFVVAFEFDEEWGLGSFVAVSDDGKLLTVLA
jgi:hypothetical protein